MTTPSPGAPHQDPVAPGSTASPNATSHAPSVRHFHADGLGARPSATGSTRILGLDGLRAVAVALVLGFHFGLGWLGGGFFGVDVFYVLSGYLITGLLLAEFERRDRIGLAAFWLRRARRLLPALLLVLVAVTLLVRFVEPTGAIPGYRGSALSALFYVSNWWQVADRGELLRGHRGHRAADPHLVAGRRGAVLPGVAAGGPRRAPPRRSFRRGVRAVLVVAALGRGRVGRRDGRPLPSRRQHHPDLLRHRHPRPVGPGRRRTGVPAHPGRASTGRDGHGPRRPGPGGPCPADGGRPQRPGRDRGPVLVPGRRLDRPPTGADSSWWRCARPWSSWRS